MWKIKLDLRGFDWKEKVVSWKLEETERLWKKKEELSNFSKLSFLSKCKGFSTKIKLLSAKGHLLTSILLKTEFKVQSLFFFQGIKKIKKIFQKKETWMQIIGEKRVFGVQNNRNSLNKPKSAKMRHTNFMEKKRRRMKARKKTYRIQELRESFLVSTGQKFEERSQIFRANVFTR